LAARGAAVGLAVVVVVGSDAGNGNPGITCAPTGAAAAARPSAAPSATNALRRTNEDRDRVMWCRGTEERAR
jgi:hypothetical protein